MHSFCLGGKMFRARHREKVSLLAQGASLGYCQACTAGDGACGAGCRGSGSCAPDFTTAACGSGGSACVICADD